MDIKKKLQLLGSSSKSSGSSKENILLRWETILAVILLIALALLFRENFWMLFLLMCLVTASRASALYDHLKVEIHAMTILAAGSVFGMWPAVFIAVASTPFINKVGKIFGSFQKPLWVLLDTLYLSTLGIVAHFIPQANLPYYGLIAIIFIGNGVINAVRILAFKDPVMRRFVLSLVNVSFNYVVLWNFLPVFLNFIQ